MDFPLWLLYSYAIRRLEEMEQQTEAYKQASEEMANDQSEEDSIKPSELAASLGYGVKAMPAGTIESQVKDLRDKRGKNSNNLT